MSGTYCSCTVRKEGEYLPDDFTGANIRKGGTFGLYAEGIVVPKLKDKRQVLYISTEFENTLAVSINAKGQLWYMPLPIVHSNAGMSGVL